MNAHLSRSVISALRTVVPLLLLLNLTGCSPEDGELSTSQPSQSKGRLTAPESGRQYHRSVGLDIKPSACPNRLNARSQGVFSVTILGADDFDAHDIDVASVALEGVAPVGAKVKDKLSRCAGDEDDSGDDSSGQDGASVDEGGKGDHRTANGTAANSYDNDDSKDDGSSDDNNDAGDDVYHECLCMFREVDYRDVCTLTERRHDGFEDLNLKFRTSDVVQAVGAYSSGSVVVLTLTGNLNDGTPFAARDCVRIVGTPPIETVSAPNVPTGPQLTWPGVQTAYCTEGATNSEGHPLEYQFDFDALGTHDFSAWADSACAEKTWSEPTAIVVKARARCALHPDTLSEWSEGLMVTVAEVTDLPEIHFTTKITKIIAGAPTTITRSYDPAVLDTVGMFRPFAISYHGTTVNGMIRAYRFFSLTSSVDLDGENIWTTDLSDTLRNFPNRGGETIPSGVFRLGAQCRDDAGAESNVDAGTFTEGVCQIAVNYDPDTRIFRVTNTYSKGGVIVVDPVNFEDSEPDTVPYNSWVTLFYDGWDSPYDSSLCQDVVNKCIKYQVQYTRTAELDGGEGGTISSTIRWLPEGGEDNNLFGTPDSTSLTHGSETYNLRARSIDEYEKPDGTPDEVTVTGNFTPTIDEYSLVNYDGTIPGDGDTLTWDYWNPANYHGSIQDTLDFSNPADFEVVKEFFFVIGASGHDSPKEQDGAGVKGWRYLFRRASDGMIARLGLSGFWADAPTVNVLADTIRLTRRYRWDPVDPSYWMEDFATLPSYLNTEYDFTVHGRDLGLTDIYEQFMYVRPNPEDPVIKVRLNTYNASPVARWTGLLGQRFYFAMRR